jgi:hypothetical protein
MSRTKILPFFSRPHIHMSWVAAGNRRGAQLGRRALLITLYVEPALARG